MRSSPTTLARLALAGLLSIGAVACGYTEASDTGESTQDPVEANGS